MDLRQYFRKIRGVEASISDKFPLLTSLDTEDGGKAGVIVEVPRYEAARMIVEGRARLATDEEKQAHQAQLTAAQKAIADVEAAQRLQFDLLISAERAAHSKTKSSK